MPFWPSLSSIRLTHSSPRDHQFQPLYRTERSSAAQVKATGESEYERHHPETLLGSTPNRHKHIAWVRA